MATKEKRPPKTIKEIKFVNRFAETGNATQAAMEVYDAKSRDVARSIGSENLAKLDIVDVLKKHNVDPDRVGVALDEGLKAERVHSSHTEPDKVIADHATRHKFVETSIDLLGMRPQKEQGNTINIVTQIKGDIDNFGIG